MRIVLDANVLASGIFWGGYPLRVLDLWARDQIDVLVSEQILLEYNHVLTELGQEEERSHLAQQWTAFVAQHATMVTPVSSVKVCRDPDDDKYLGCAADGGADYIVSGDEDLLALKQFVGIPIVTPRRFIELRG